MARPRRWTDEDLTRAIAASSTWDEVVTQIGRKRTSKTSRLAVQGHALRLGVTVDHLPPMYPEAKPTRIEWTDQKDADFIEAVKAARSWAEVFRLQGRRISGSSYPTLRRRAEELGLDTSHFLGMAWNGNPVDGEVLPFSRQPRSEYLHAAAAALASAWFLERGYRVATPIEPAPYDLVVESDIGIMRVQVKSTTYQDNGRWHVAISRQKYTAGVVGAGGARRQCAYEGDQVDFFFIVTADGSQFLVPWSATNGQQSLTLDIKYAAYRVQ